MKIPVSDLFKLTALTLPYSGLPMWSWSRRQEQRMSVCVGKVSSVFKDKNIHISGMQREKVELTTSILFLLGKWVLLKLHCVYPYAQG